MALTDAAALAADPAWRGRVTACAIKVAIQVIRETPADEDAGERLQVRRKRAALAARVLASPTALTETLAWDLAVAVHEAGFDGSIGDNGLTIAVRRSWDGIATVTHEDRTGG
jgi:hypothetical protein